MILLAGGAIAALALVFQAVYAPLASWRKNAKGDLARAEGLYDLVVEAAAIAPQSDGAPAAIGAAERPLRAVVTSTANDAGVDLIFVNARPDGAVEANAGPTDPERLFNWIGALSAEHGATISFADVSRTQDGDGTVRGRLIFGG